MKLEEFSIFVNFVNSLIGDNPFSMHVEFSTKTKISYHWFTHLVWVSVGKKNYFSENFTNVLQLSQRIMINSNDHPIRSMLNNTE